MGFTTRRWIGIVMVVVAASIMPACGPGDPSRPAPAISPAGTGTVKVGGRPVVVHVPASYRPSRPVPLVLALHGYSSDANELETYLRLTPQSERRGFIYAYPEGSVDDQGERFWNATDACCAFSGSKTDDSHHLSEVIATLAEMYRIDRARVYLIGHSNGGFMAFRMACDHADQIAAIVSINGASWNDATRCRPSEAVSVLAVHSSADETIAFGGGTIGPASYPSAATTVATWLDHDGCARTGRPAPAMDLVTDLRGAETSVLIYDRGCRAGSAVQAWTVNGGTHVPRLGPAFAPAVTDFLLSRRKTAG